MRKRVYVAAASLTVLVLIVAMLALRGGTFEAEKSTKKFTSDVATATVDQGDLSERVEVKGTLGLGQKRAYGTQLSGIVTSIAALGTKLEAGSEMMRVNDAPVVAMRGEIPAWRAFEPGMSDGRDVMQLEKNLQQLGYFTREPDTHFDGASRAAVTKWQKERGLPVNGRIKLGRIVFIPSDVVVAAHKVVPGEPASEQTIECTGSVKEVTAEVQPHSRHLLPEGTSVNVQLPDGKTVEGLVKRVGQAVETEDKTGVKSVRIPVTISLKDPSVAEQYLDVSVGIHVNRVVKENVLSVPVRALLAQPGNAYAVEVVRNGDIVRVPVELGVFADSRVEIREGALSEGDKVVVAE